MRRTGWNLLPAALPPLRGAPRTLFLSTWWVLFTLCSVGLVTDVLYNYRRTQEIPPTQLVGIAVQQDGTGLVIVQALGREATIAGVHRGDRLLTVDGHAVADRSSLYARLAGPIGSTVTLVTRRGADEPAMRRLTRDPVHQREAFASAGLNRFVYELLTGVGSELGNVPVLFFAAILITLRSRDPLAPWASLTMLLGLICAGVGAGIPGVGGNADALLMQVARPVWELLLFSMLALFPDARFRPRWVLAVIVLIVVAVASWSILPIGDGARGVATVALFLIVLAPPVARYRAMAPGIARQQVRWGLLGLGWAAAGIVAQLVLNLLIGPATSFAQTAWLTIALNFVYVGLTLLIFGTITVALLRYRLYDAEATISRSVAYGALTLALLGVFAGTEKLIEILGEEYFGEQLGALAGGLGAALAAVLIVPFHHRVTHWAEKRFRSGLMRLRHGLPLLVGDMRETATPAMLAEAMLKRVEAGVRARHGAVLVGDTLLDVRDLDEAVARDWLARQPDLPREGLEIDRADPLFPLRLSLRADGVGQVGWLLLGSRPDGTFFGREERAALRDIADLGAGPAREPSLPARAPEKPPADAVIGQRSMVCRPIASVRRHAVRSDRRKFSFQACSNW